MLTLHPVTFESAIAVTNQVCSFKSAIAVHSSVGIKRMVSTGHARCQPAIMCLRDANYSRRYSLILNPLYTFNLWAHIAIVDCYKGSRK